MSNKTEQARVILVGSHVVGPDGNPVGNNGCTCRDCKCRFDPGQMLVLRHLAVGVVYKQLDLCMRCRGADGALYHPGATISGGLRDGATELKWREHDEDGNPYGPLLDVSLMGLRLMKPSLIVRPATRDRRERNRELTARRSNSLLDLQPQPTPSNLMTVSQTGRALGISAQTVRAWEKAGRLPGHRVQGRLDRLFDEDVVMAMKKSLEEQRPALRENKEDHVH